MIVFGVSTFPYVSRMEADRPTPWMGVLERVNIYGIMLWVAALAVLLWRGLPGRTAKKITSAKCYD
jgi:hypothetical protein